MFKKYDNPAGYPGIQYWMDENGTDWYTYADNASLDTMKILVREDGMILSADIDATKLTPTDLCLFELSLDEIPSDFAPGKYSYDGNKLFLTPVVERPKSVEEIKNELFLLMLKTKMTAEEKKYFEELKELLQEKLSK